jgi:hypothetical protein
MLSRAKNLIKIIKNNWKKDKIRSKMFKEFLITIIKFNS